MKHKYDGAWRLTDGRVVLVAWDFGWYMFRELGAVHCYDQLSIRGTRDALRNARRWRP